MRTIAAIMAVLMAAGVACAASYYPSVEAYDSQSGKSGKVSPMREQAVSEPNRKVGSIFAGVLLDTNFWLVATVNASNVVGGAQLTMHSGTNAATTNSVSSVRTARYVAGSANFYRSVVRVPDTGLGGNERRWGVGTVSETDGTAFVMRGTDLCVSTYKDGVETSWTNGGWNGTAFTMDTNSHTYEIWWTNSKLWWYIDDILRHSYTASNTTWTSGMEFRLKNCNKNTGSTTNRLLEIRVMSIYGFRDGNTEPTYRNLAGERSLCLKYSAGRLHRIVVNKAGTLCSIYDATNAANPIAVVDINKTTGGTGDFTYSVPFYNGLYVVTTGAGADVTVIYE